MILYKCECHRKTQNYCLTFKRDICSSKRHNVFINIHQKLFCSDGALAAACIREYGSTLYVGLARAISPTNTNFRLTFLLTRLQESLYEDLAVKSIKFEVYHHFSGL